MQYSVIAPSATGTTADPYWIGEYARHAEACGFESIVLVEHPVVIGGYSSTYPYAGSGKMEIPEDCAIPDPLETLAYLAGITTSIGLATGVLILPNHHPVPLAKRIATLDRLSGGRVRLCVGVGWMREEIEACGTDFTTRGRRTDESIEVMRALWSQSGSAGATHHGEFFDFTNAISYPKPVRPEGVPIHIGGHSAAAARRAGRYGDGLQPLGLAGEELRSTVALMHETAERTGRDPDTLELTLGHLVTRITTERAGKLADLGADRLVLAPSDTPDLEQAKDELSACAERVGLAARAGTPS